MRLSKPAPPRVPVTKAFFSAAISEACFLFPHVRFCNQITETAGFFSSASARSRGESAIPRDSSCWFCANPPCAPLREKVPPRRFFPRNNAKAPTPGGPPRPGRHPRYGKQFELSRASNVARQGAAANNRRSAARTDSDSSRERCVTSPQKQPQNPAPTKALHLTSSHG